MVQQNIMTIMKSTSSTICCLAAHSGDLQGLAALLGHSNLSTLMVYTEPRLEDLAGRMERVG